MTEGAIAEFTFADEADCSSRITVVPRALLVQNYYICIYAHFPLASNSPLVSEALK